MRRAAAPLFRASRRWVALLALCLAQGLAGAACQLRAMEIPVRIVNHRPIVSMVINGTELNMLLDSGAFFSFLARSTAEQLGLKLRSLPDGLRVLGHDGAVETQLTRVAKVQFNLIEVPNVEFLVGGNELGSGIQGILGRNFLSIADVEYDLNQGMVRLMFPKGECSEAHLAYWAGDAPIIETPLEPLFGESNPAIRVRVKINGNSLRALLDTGAPVTTLSLRGSRRANIPQSDLEPVGRSGGLGTGFLKSWRGPMAKFELGGEVISNNRVSIDESKSDEHDLLIGLDYFLSHRVYISKAKGKLLATWNGTPVFSTGAADPGLDTQSAARPAEVSPDDAAALSRRAAAAMTRGDDQAALADLNRVIELQPDAEHRLARARLHLKLRAGEAALADLDEALRQQPSLHDARLLRARVRHAKGQRDATVRDLSELDAALPPSSHLRYAMADLYAMLDRVPEALRQWELWMPTHADDRSLANALNSRCWLRVRANTQLPEALEDCKQAVKRDRENATHLDSLGWAHLRLGDAKRAIDAFSDALERKPDLAYSLYGRSLAARRLADEAAATRDLEAARKLRRAIEADAKRLGLPTE